MPLSAKVALAVLLAASILRAFYGPAPSSPRRGLATAVGLAGGGCYLAALAVAWGNHVTGASLLIALSIETMCLAVWLARGRDDRGDGEWEPEPDPPVDWAEFDRLRDDWSRTPVTL